MLHILLLLTYFFPGPSEYEAQVGMVNAEREIFEFTSEWMYAWEQPGFPADRSTDFFPDSTSWTPTALPFSTNEYNGQILWLRARLPSDLPDNPVLFATSVIHAFELFVEDSLVYQSGVLAPDKNNKYSLATPHFIPLPPDAGGRTLYFRIFSESKQQIGLPQPLYIVTETQKILSVIAVGIEEFVFGVVLLFMALVCIYLVIGHRGDLLWPLLAFGLLATSTGLHYLHNTYLGMLLFSHNVVSYYMTGVIMLFPVGLLALHERLIGVGPLSLVRRLWQFHLLFGCAVLLLDAFGVLIFLDYFLWFFLILSASLVMLIISTIQKLRTGKRDVRIYAFGIAFVVVLGFHDTIMLGLAFNPQAPELSTLGFMLFIFVLAYSLQDQFSQNTRQLRQYATELEQRQDELEQANDRLEEYSNTLEQRVSERTADLNQSLQDLQAAQSRLVQTEKLASLGQLTAGIAHEIRNPLNFVNNFAALSTELANELEEEIEANKERTLKEAVGELSPILDDLKQNAKKINEHGRRADSIIRNMLEHASTKSGTRQTVNVNEFVEEYTELAIGGMHAQTPNFKAQFELDLDPNVHTVELVPQELGRVLINLVNNSFYAIHERAATNDEAYTPKLTVATKAVDEAIEIHIADNGTGIPQDIQERIFEPFFTTKPPGSGTGLGLSLSYDIITQGHAGSLKMTSKEGEGSTFTITLPATSR